MGWGRLAPLGPARGRGGRSRKPGARGQWRVGWARRWFSVSDHADAELEGEATAALVKNGATFSGNPHFNGFNGLAFVVNGTCWA